MPKSQNGSLGGQYTADLKRKFLSQILGFLWPRDCKINGTVPYLKHMSRFQIFPRSHIVE